MLFNKQFEASERDNMENIAKLQDFVCEYFDKELAKFYSFSMWKDLVCLLREARQNPNAIKHFDRYGEAFRVRMVVADVLASEDKWAPCLNVVYGWKIGKSIVPVSLMTVSYTHLTLPTTERV